MPEPLLLGSFTLPNGSVGPVLEFLEEKLVAGAAATTLRVYIAAIAAQRELDEIPLGRRRMTSAFMHGVRWLRPVRVPSWDLSVVLEGLMAALFEPLESAPEWILTLKVILLLALMSLKRVGDLQALCQRDVYGLRPGSGQGHPAWSRSGLAMSPRFYLHRFALKWSCFTPFILLHLLQVRMRGFTCSVLSEL